MKHNASWLRRPRRVSEQNTLAVHAATEDSVSIDLVFIDPGKGG